MRDPRNQQKTMNDIGERRAKSFHQETIRLEQSVLEIYDNA